MVRGELKGKDTGRIRDSLHNLRDVQSSLNKENKKDVKLYPGRKTSEREAVKSKKGKTGKTGKTAKKEGERKTIPELEAEESIRRACEAINNAIISDKPPASAATVNKAAMEIKKAVIRCGRI